MINTGHYIKETRTKKKYTLQDVATYLNIHPAIACQIEKGKVTPTKHQILGLSHFFEEDDNGLLGIYQQERIENEVAAGTQECKNKSSIIRNTEAASKRYANMMHELNQLGKENLNIKVHKPTYPLNEYVESVTYYNGHNFGSLYEKIMPDGMVNLYIELDGRIRTLSNGKGDTHLKNYWISGIQKQHQTYGLEPFQTSLNIRFTPGGFFTLTQIPQLELKDIIIEADLVFGNSIKKLRESILGEVNAYRVFNQVEFFLKEKLESSYSAHPLISFICNHISYPLDAIVKKTGFSQKHLISIFKKHIGVTPKFFQRINRFNQALEQIQRSQTAVDWTDVAYCNHYFDQAHFIKDFNFFSGMSPQHYLTLGSTCSRLVREIK